MLATYMENAIFKKGQQNITQAFYQTVCEHVKETTLWKCAIHELGFM